MRGGPVRTAGFIGVLAGSTLLGAGDCRNLVIPCTRVARARYGGGYAQSAPTPSVRALRLNAFAAFRASVPIRFADSTGFDGECLRIEILASETTDRDAVTVGLIANVGDSRRTLTLDYWEPCDLGLVAWSRS